MILGCVTICLLLPGTRSFGILWSFIVWPPFIFSFPCLSEHWLNAFWFLVLHIPWYLVVCSLAECCLELGPPNSLVHWQNAGWWLVVSIPWFWLCDHWLNAVWCWSSVISGPWLCDHWLNVTRPWGGLNTTVPSPYSPLISISQPTRGDHTHCSPCLYSVHMYALCLLHNAPKPYKRYSKSNR